MVQPHNYHPAQQHIRKALDLAIDASCKMGDICNDSEVAIVDRDIDQAIERLKMAKQRYHEAVRY